MKRTITIDGVTLTQAQVLEAYAKLQESESRPLLLGLECFTQTHGDRKGIYIPLFSSVESARQLLKGEDPFWVPGVYTSSADPCLYFSTHLTDGPLTVVNGKMAGYAVERLHITSTLIDK